MSNPNPDRSHLDRSRHGRSRWAAVGAAVAVTLGAGGISLAGASDPPSSYVPVTPCRVLDTRTGTGPQTGPLGPGATLTVPITGDQGECAGIPAGATAVALNVTTVDATAWSYLTIWPTDEARPNASSLNYEAGQGPTPNAVLADLSVDGTIDLYNFDGSVEVIADVNGYFLPAGGAGGAAVTDAYTRGESDARFATKADTYSRADSDARFATKADTYSRAETYSKAEVDELSKPQRREHTQSVTAAAGVPGLGSSISFDLQGGATFNTAATSHLVVDLPTPHDARMTSIRLRWSDTSSANIVFYLYHRTPTGTTAYGVVNASSSNIQAAQTYAMPANTPYTLGEGSWFLVAQAPSHTGTLKLLGVSYTYELVA